MIERLSPPDRRRSLIIYNLQFFNLKWRGQQRREILDWYHLKENLYRVGGSLRRLRRVENYLWQGLIAEAIEEFDELKNKQARNFQEYLRKHQGRIPDYQLYQELGICIGSGSVESWIKQIDERPRVGVRRKGTRESWFENQDYWRTVGTKKCSSNVKTAVRLFQWRYRSEYFCLAKSGTLPKFMPVIQLINTISRIILMNFSSHHSQIYLLCC